MYEMNPQQDTMLAPIQLNHWYKCAVEINITTKTITYSLDGVPVQTKDATAFINGLWAIDNLLVFRGMEGAEGPKSYYVDDIVIYTK